MIYQKKGDAPILLIVSGIHGDEAETAGLVKKNIEVYYDQLPNFFYIQTASPSAVLKGTRENNQNHDLNRNFIPKTDDREALEIMKTLKSYHFDVCFDFHEDPIDPYFYTYDYFGEKLENTPAWEKLTEEIINLGVSLLNGVDDPNDPVLGTEFKNGLHYFPNFAPGETNTDGMLQTWLGVEKIAEKYINPEIPGNLSTDKKSKIVNAIFRHLILKK